ncbi:MAG: hypothetical protein GF418_12335, partial [Chitinivibrionales bacterium]|nr:hypothetical protein [Chitinivibrionales bacterium]MBD3396407.1 hypothetical protein [Chitinivibrionales bacterium]
MQKIRTAVLVLMAALYGSTQQTPTPPAGQGAPPDAAQEEPGPKGIAEDRLNPIESIPVSDTVTIPVLDFKNTDVRDVLRAIGMQYNVNIYLEPSATGTISLYLADVPVRKALDFIVKRARLSYTVENGIVKVFKYAPPPPPPPPKPPVAFAVRDSLVSLDLKDLSPNEVARLFIDSAGINVVVEGSGNKKITSHLKNMPVEKALKVLYEANGFEVSASEGVYYVGAKSWGEQDQ